MIITCWYVQQSIWKHEFHFYLQLHIWFKIARYLSGKLFSQMHAQELLERASLQVQMILGKYIIHACANHLRVSRLRHLKQMIQVLKVGDVCLEQIGWRFKLAHKDWLLDVWQLLDGHFRILLLLGDVQILDILGPQVFRTPVNLYQAVDPIDFWLFYKTGLKMI